MDVMNKNITIGILLVLIASVGIYLFTRPADDSSFQNNIDQEQDSDQNEMSDQDMSDNMNDDVQSRKSVVAIGQSVEGENIAAYRYGTGTKEILLVGGIHGGYSWNTALLGYQLVDYFEDNIDEVPENVTLSIIPVLNPDGLEEVVGTSGSFNPSDFSATLAQRTEGRFNENNVDLNRNFDCDWESNAKWQNKDVDGGDSAFSEPESQAVRNYINNYDVEAAVVYYSSANGVYASNCYGEILSETRDLTNTYADASGYPAYEEFDFYEITGDMVNWMAKMEIPAISVLLSDHENTEWSKNIAGVKAVLDYYAE
jgi:hypothetical protein